MPSSTSARGLPDAHQPKRLAVLWAGLLTGPLLWLVLLQANYVMSYVSCESSRTWFLHAATLASAAIVAAVGWRTWRLGAGDRTLEEPPSPPVSPETSESRATWMAYAGAAISAWFVIVILAMEVPVIVLRICQ
jgi:hypothetical protein